MHDEHSDGHSGGQEDSDRGPERVFRVLKDRPTDELDSGALWRRIEGDLEPRTASWFDRAAAAIGLGGLQPATLRLAGVGALALLVVLAVDVVWLAPGLNEQALDSPAELVPLSALAGSEASEPAMPANTQPAWILDVRLVRGYSGAAPEDAMVSAGAGAGGADRLADLRGALEGLMPFDEIALVGQWQGAVDATRGVDGAEGANGAKGAAATIARLSESFELRFAAQSAGTGVNLADVLLNGAGRPLVADELALMPGRPYLFGVQAEGEDSDTGSLVLAVRLLPAEPTGSAGPGAADDSQNDSDNLPERR